MAKYKIGTDLYDLPEEKVESFLSKYPDALEVTDEIQTTPVEGKTNDTVETGAPAVSETGQAPESTESDLVDTSLVSQPKRKSVRGEQRTKELKRVEVEKQQQAKEAYVDLENQLASIPQADYDKAFSDIYFNIDNRPVKRERLGRDQDFRVVETFMPIEEYLGEEKFKQYQEFTQNGTITPIDSENEIEIQQAKGVSKYNAKKKTSEIYLRDVPENIQQYMPNAAGTYNTVEEAYDALEIAKQNVDQNILNYENSYKQYTELSKPYEDRLKEIKSELSVLSGGDFKMDYFDSPDRINRFNELVLESNELMADYNAKEIDQFYSDLIKQKELVDFEVTEYNNSISDSALDELNSRQVIEAAIGLDYSFGARTAMALEEFFVGGAKNLAFMGAQNWLQFAKDITSDDRMQQFYDDALTSMSQYSQNYNAQLAKKREEKIPEALKLEDIGKGKINFIDWFKESFAENSPSIITTFVPGALTLKGAAGVRAATGVAAKRAALRKQKELSVAGMRTAQATFFGAETGMKFGQLETEQLEATKAIPKLEALIEETQDLERKKELQNQLDDFKRISNYSLNQKAFNSFASGTTATLAETVGSLRFVQGADDVIKQIGKNKFKKEFYDKPFNFSANVVGKTLSGVGRLSGRAIPINTLEETLTLIGQNSFDNIVLKENKSLIEGIDADFFANVNVGTIGMLAPRAGGNILNLFKNEFRIRDEVKQNQKDVLELIDVQNTIPNLKGGELTAARKRKNEIVEKLALADALSVQKLASMSPEQIFEAADLSRQMREVKREAYQLGSTGKLSDAGKQARQELENQYTALDNRRTELLNTKKLKMRDAAKKLSEFLGGDYVNTNAEYHLGLYDFYENAAMVMMPKDGEYITIENPNDTAELEQKLSKYDEATRSRIINGFQQGANGANAGNDIIINSEAVKRNIGISTSFGDGKYAATAPLEELFHIQNKSENLLDADGKLSDQATKAVDEAIELLNNKKELGEISDKDYNDLVKRFELYKTGGRGKVILKSGKRGAATVDSEELMAQMNNAVGLGIFKASDFNNMPSLKSFINGISDDLFTGFSWAFQLKTGNDVFKFINNYQTKVQEGVAITGGAADEDIVKEQRSEEASNRVQEIYEQQGVAGAFDIIEQFKPITSRIVERRSEAPGFDRQLLTDEIETGQRGILDLISEYNPDSGVPLAAYINKFLPARAIEASKRVLGEEFTEDVSEARGVAAEEVTVTETPTKPEAKAIDPFRIMPNVKETATAEVQKSITDKGVDVTEVTYKELKDVAPYQTVADFFGIPVSRISNPKDNLRKSDNVANIQRWILKNEPTLKNLFTEANREVVEIKEGNRVIRKGGEPTAIPRNLLNKFYNKGERVGNNFQWTLKPYDRTTFLEAVGIKDGKVDPNFTPRAAEAQTIKGILDMYTRNLGNVIARETIEAREDIAPAEKARAKAEVAKGKPRLMFNKAANIINVSDTFNLDYNAKDKLLEVFIGEKSFDFKTEKGIKDFVEAAKTNLLPLMPKEFWFGKKSTFMPSYYVVGSSDNKQTKQKYKDLYNNVYVPAINELKADESIKYGPPIKGIDDYSVSSYSTIFKNKDAINKNIKNGNIQEWNQKVSTIHREMWKRFNKAMVVDGKINKTAVKAIANYLGLVASDTSHWHKLGAQFIGYSDKLQGKRFEYEHAMPATMAYLYLLNASLSKSDFNTAYDLIIDNYKLIALDKAMDDKLRNARTGQGYSLQRRMPDDWSVVDGNWWQRYFNDIVVLQEGGINPKSIIGLDGRNFETIYGINAEGKPTTPALAESKAKASIENNNKGPASIKFSRNALNEQVLKNLGDADKAMANARNPEASVKKIRVFDFDDTLAKSNSQVLYELPDGTTGKLNATQFAQRAGELQEQGAEFDFSEFSKVVDGKKGPVFKAIENIVAKRGAEDVFILTARPASAAGPIKEFMDALGVNLPIENIVGLGDGTAEAKARWMTAKAAEGYNDFFFVDDAYKNVKAVQDALDVFDVKSKTQQAKVKFSKASDLDKGFNDIIQQTTGIASEKEYKRVKAEVAGASRGMAIRGIPYSAQDLVGLLYETLSKGDLGDRQMAWWKTHLLNPYARAMNDIDNARLAMMQDYRALKKQLGLVPKNLRKKIPGEPFTNEQAVRVYIWNKQGMEVPGISKSDLKDLTEHVQNNAELQVFADQLIAIQKGDEYAKPKQGWPAGSITTDLLESINTTKRAKYLEQWQENVDVIFSEKNMNKLEAAYGKKYRVALENMLERMKTGRNRRFSDDSLTGRFTDWLQGSIGTIMFFNTRSALLQTISAMNFINFTDNNPLAAAKAFGNQKQFWSDFVTLINSDFLKARRSGLRMNVNEADIADMAKKGGPRAVINKLLQLGFAPTQIADSFAIASGGATFYRNRINTYKKQGLSQQEAETKAFEDFRENAEESQQSARPDRISMQQAGPLGRLILAFQNTPSQYARIIDKSVRDLKNGRGDAKTNISKIIYYSTVQNLLFNALQQALFAFAFGDEEPEDKEKEKKYVDIANSMMDSLLRGTGIAGGVLSVGKNAILRIVRESEKARPNYEKVGADLLKIAPPVSSKLSKINQAARSYKWDKEEMKEKGWSLDNPAYLAGANVISALTNVPLDRGIKKANNVVNATDSDLETWERLALLGGWQDWEIGIDEETKTNKPQPRKTTRTKKRKVTKR